MANEEDLLENLRQTGSEVTQKLALLEKELAKRPNSPQPGDIFVFACPETTGLQWVILHPDAKKSQWLTVPADGVPMVGSNDIELSKKALCSPLALRCQHGLWIDAHHFDMNLRVGYLETCDLQRALDKLQQISTGKLRRTISQQQVDEDLEYEEWMEQVIQGREVLKRSFQLMESTEAKTKPGRLSQLFSNLYDRLVTLLPLKQMVPAVLTVGIVLGVGIYPLYTTLYTVGSDIESGVVIENIDDASTNIVNETGITLAELESDAFQVDLDNFQEKGQSEPANEVPFESNNPVDLEENVYNREQTVITHEEISAESTPQDFSQLSPDDWLYQCMDKIQNGEILEAIEMLKQFHAKYPDYSPE